MIAQNQLKYTQMPANMGGSTPMQNNRPIAFASKNLTVIETRYAKTACECLSVVFGLEKFHTHIYGCQITVYNDH